MTDAVEKQLLERWRVSRSPNVADVLQQLASDAWLEQTHKLARTITMRARGPVKKLLDLDDPRLTVFLVECLFAARWPSSGARPLWEAIFDKWPSIPTSGIWRSRAEGCAQSSAGGP